MILSAINDKFDGRGQFSSFRWESNLSLIARETTRLLVTHRLTPFLIDLKASLLKKAATEDVKLLS